tara:strand:+ start:143 stop:1294 length:1152 start_codon:yes stop_codon:yes gene_type:complete
VALMTETYDRHENEIDLFKTLQILWAAKWKIIIFTFLSSLVGIFVIYNKSDSFNVSIPIKSNKVSADIRYTSLNDILEENGLDFHIDANSTFNLFELEMTDYNEIKNILKNNEFIKYQIKDLDEANAMKALNSYTSMFELNKVSKKNPIGNQIYRSLSFQWHDSDEGKSIVKEVLLLSLENVKNSIINEISKLAEILNNKDQRRLDKLNIELSLLLQNETERLEKRILYLLEQSEIAKTLGIETNSLNANTLSQLEMNNLSYSNNFIGDSPFYLRGYKAINKEIEIIRSRSAEDQMLSADRYLLLKKDIRLIENNPASLHLLNALKSFENSSSTDLISYNLGMITSVSQNNPLYIFIISILIGGIISTIYVLVSYAVRNQEKR